MSMQSRCSQVDRSRSDCHEPEAEGELEESLQGKKTTLSLNVVN
jgi:hypothetical protein